MKISKKLMIIVLLTFIEVSVTILAAFEMSKGSGFHQLNILHLKYNAEFSDQIYAIENGAVPNVNSLRTVISNVRQQPVDCLNDVNALEKVVMTQIGTYYALDICVDDLAAADLVLAKLDDYEMGLLDKIEILTELKTAGDVFRESSTMFEKPIAETVSFIFKSTIPLIVFISFFNILFISYLSRSISKSISGVTDLLKTKSGAHDFNNDTDNGVPGEIKQLLAAARSAIKEETMQKEINQKLDRLVQEKTDSLLIANEELTQFSYRASHDLKSPLVAISRLADCILEDIADGDTAEAAESVKKIQDRSKRLAALISDIMDLSRADLADEENQVIDVPVLLAELRSSVSDSVGGHRVEVICDDKTQRELVSQRVRLKQVLYNLVTNGIKYADKKSENSYVSVIFSTEDNRCCLEVSDNGVGIPEEFQEKIFQRFQRFHPDLAAGSGLGLSIVKSNIDKLDATVEFSSSPNGTNYSIYFPEQLAA